VGLGRVELPTNGLGNRCPGKNSSVTTDNALISKRLRRCFVAVIESENARL